MSRCPGVALLAMLLAPAAAALAHAAPAAPPSVPVPRVTFASSNQAVSQLLRLADQRLALMPAVAAWKWRHHAPVSAPAREQAVIAQAGQRAAQLGLSTMAVERIFALQVRLAGEQESRLERRWRQQGYDYQGEPPSLPTVLRPRLDHLTLELLQALYLAAPTLASRDFPTRYAATAGRLLHAAGWSGRSRAQLLEALHAVAAPAGPPLERIRAARLLRIGTTGDYAPFSLERAGGLTGTDVTLGGELAAAMGARAVFVHTSWGALLQDLRAGRFDVAMGGISITPARAAAAAFSIPYYAGGKTIIARCADAAGLSSLAALDQPRYTLIVNPGGTNQRFVQTHLHRVQVRVFADNRGIFAEILAHRADAMITDDVEAELQTRVHPGLCRSIPGTLTHEDKAVLMLRQPALVAAVDDWLRGQIATGRPARLMAAALQAAASGTKQ